MNLCLENGFKEVAMRLEKPTYGAFIHELSSAHFITDEDMLSKWSESKKNNQSVFDSSCDLICRQEIEQWHTAVDKQCQRLMEVIPRCMKQGVQAWLNRIALEYLSYSRRQEMLFGVSRYFLMDVLTVESWTKAGRLDEKKLAERMLKDERLTVLQRYRMACVYCQDVHIQELWNGLTEEEKRLILSSDNPNSSQENHPLVLLWSRQMEEEFTFRRNYQWCKAAELAVRYGNRAALISCWNKLKERWKKLGKHTWQKIVIKMALKSLEGRQRIQQESQIYLDWKGCLILSKFPRTVFVESFACYNLPSYYSEFMCFFLSQMDQELQLTFFKQAFQSRLSDFVLECYLDWSHRDDFIPTMSRLWGIIPKDKFGQYLLTLASKYAESYEWEGLQSLVKEIRYYDYRNLLQSLWAETPEEYKRYVFLEKKSNCVIYPVKNEGRVLLPLLLKRSPFQREDEVLFKQIFCYQPQEERITMMYSATGEDICAILTQKEKWSFLNWLLEECLPKEEILNFKRQFILSKCGRKLCLKKLEENCENLVEKIIDWSFDLDAEKAHYKYALITSGIEFLLICYSFLRSGDIATVERMINFCIPIAELSEPILARCIEYSYKYLLRTCKREELDAILAWKRRKKKCRKRSLKS
ncbi:uncharacterized protein NPIL_320992 [Nephila pilipes]|nr:uncharacterized protein NPIL_320992 [Nephila pilipes]